MNETERTERQAKQQFIVGGVSEEKEVKWWGSLRPNATAQAINERQSQTQC